VLRARANRWRDSELDCALEEGCFPAPHSGEATTQEGTHPELPNDDAGVREHVPRRDDAAHGHLRP
jgi:hypothetical protein